MIVLCTEAVLHVAILTLSTVPPDERTLHSQRQLTKRTGAYYPVVLHATQCYACSSRQRLNLSHHASLSSCILLPFLVLQPTTRQIK